MTGKIDSTAWEKVKRALSSRFRGGITRVGSVYDDVTLETQLDPNEVRLRESIFKGEKIETKDPFPEPDWEADKSHARLDQEHKIESPRPKDK